MTKRLMVLAGVFALAGCGGHQAGGNEAAGGASAPAAGAARAFAKRVAVTVGGQASKSWSALPLARVSVTLPEVKQTVNKVTNVLTPGLNVFTST